MDWYSTVFELIDMRSFSNLWFWIVLAVVWSSASHWVLGVPFDMVTRARRKGDKAAEDLTDLLRINTGRLLYISEEAGLWIIAAGAFFLTGFAVLGWVYGVEIAQALFLLGFPMSLVSLLSVRTAKALHEKDTDLNAVYKRLGRHRLIVQALGMVSIFVTAMWGMYVNLSIGVLGG
ncbi:MAG: component of SufBCD complex [Marivita sp.]|uniref:component of SufBCD complex n=1 Tax=Marivita sp. TaxID=2003365 RepID=UPI003EF12805